MLERIPHSAQCSHPIFACLCPNCGTALAENAIKVNLPQQIMSLSACNDIPPEQEILSLQQQRQEGHARLFRLLELMRLTGRALYKMKEEESELREGIRRMNRVLSPIRKLPADVVGEIFTAYMEPFDISATSTIAEDSLHPRSRCSPWVLGQICRSWRQIILSMPRLWSRLRFNFQEDWQDKLLSGRTLLLGLHLQRAQNLPLDIGLHTGVEQEITNTHPMMNLILSQSYRWRTVYARVCADALTALANVRGFLPRLESIALVASSYGIYEEDEPWRTRSEGASFLQFAPRLKSLSLHGFRCDDLTLPWDQLKALKIDDSYFHAMSTNRLVQSLKKASSLLECYFECMLDDEEDDRPEVICHATLGALTLNNTSNDDSDASFVELLGSLRLPSLHTLTIQTLFTSISVLQSSLDIWGCSLTSLGLWSIPYSPDLIKLLRGLTNLQTLRIGTEIPMDFIEHLTPNRQELRKPMCPNLRKLELPTFKNFGLGDMGAAFLSMLILRKNPKRVGDVYDTEILEDVCFYSPVMPPIDQIPSSCSPLRDLGIRFIDINTGAVFV